MVQEAGHQTAQSDGQRSRQSGKSARASKGALQDALHRYLSLMLVGLQLVQHTLGISYYSM